jgi:hypothetical protein
VNVERTDEVQLLKFEGKDGSGALVDPYYTAGVLGSQVGLMDELSVDKQVEREVAVDQVVCERDLELLLA